MFPVEIKEPHSLCGRSNIVYPQYVGPLPEALPVERRRTIQ